MKTSSVSSSSNGGQNIGNHTILSNLGTGNKKYEMHY